MCQVPNRSVPGSGVTAPYGTVDDTGRVELSSEEMKRAGAIAVMKPTETSRVSDRKIREMPMKEVSRVFDVEKNSQIKNNFQLHRSSGYGHTSMFHSIDVESSYEHAATAARDVTFDIGR